MGSLKKETENNFKRYRDTWHQELQSNMSALQSSEQTYLSSYRRVATLHAWRTNIIETSVSQQSLGFFIEAQNDALTGHVLAQTGAWRGALKALRSCLENTIFCLYYKDHPVELELWLAGEHRMGFASNLEYLRKHPAFKKRKKRQSWLGEMKKEYGVLSKAVHGSAVSFRMADEDGYTQIWNSDARKLSMWSSRENATVIIINKCLATMFETKLQGAAFTNLRKSMGLVFPESVRKEFQDELKIKLPKL